MRVSIRRDEDGARTSGTTLVSTSVVNLSSPRVKRSTSSALRPPSALSRSRATNREPSPRCATGRTSGVVPVLTGKAAVPVAVPRMMRKVRVKEIRSGVVEVLTLDHGHTL